ncbi:hypothetical protein [Silvibacterium dinghuense]|uniref:Uncharacterized protein n=1 Tax=Silvibacterium dinghuense TaxID=1560006 RepID=A0A4Q1SL27_9BACT|nr:hypothetical protein [Silvibacterium dinghuense]RXS98000.1 hypothetical protein ESZ00_09180 [Silvibacterium dinghuense]
MYPLRSAEKVNADLAAPPNYPGCYPPVTEAIRNLYKAWESDRRLRRPASILAQLRLWIDPALASYKEECRSQGRKAVGIPQSPTRYLQRVGYERAIKRIHRVRDLMRRANNPLPVFTLEQLCGLEELVMPDSVVDQQPQAWPDSAAAVLDMLVRLIETCRQMRPSKRAIRGASLMDVTRRRCDYCDSLTEAAAFEESGIVPLPQQVKLETYIGELEKRSYCPRNRAVKKRLVLSRKLCSEHMTGGRTKGSALAARRRLALRETRIQETLKELKFYDCHRRKPEEGPLDAVLACFYSDLVWFICFETRDEELRRLAREFVDAGMNERKAIIAYLKRSGHPQAEIARFLGVKPPAVSRALSTIPGRYLAAGISNRRSPLTSTLACRDVG